MLVLPVLLGLLLVLLGVLVLLAAELGLGLGLELELALLNVPLAPAGALLKLLPLLVGGLALKPP